MWHKFYEKIMEFCDRMPNPAGKIMVSFDYVNGLHGSRFYGTQSCGFVFLNERAFARTDEVALWPLGPDPFRLKAIMPMKLCQIRFPFRHIALLRLQSSSMRQTFATAVYSCVAWTDRRQR
ncbi:MAG: hypothetical protein IJ523_10320 [Succinivibrionaceae bacterium]|nr:hypothetical protein [Succinivibrionaceae bacterium]